VAYVKNFEKELFSKNKKAPWRFKNALRNSLYLKRRLARWTASLVGRSEWTELKENDFLVLSEIFGPHTADVRKGIKKIILNQNPFRCFDDYSFDKNDLKCAFKGRDIVAVIVCSEHDYNFMRFVFPELNLLRIRYGFSSRVFSCHEPKKKQIAFMPKKHEQEARSLINILKFRGKLRDFEFVKMESMVGEEVAKTLKESAIFLSFNRREGFGMPAAEAMACGCVVIGYDGEGGKEFFKEEFCYPMREADLIGFAETVESVIDQFEKDKRSLLEMGKKASDFILNNYSLESEEASIILAWEKILQKHNQNL
jgi:hypothetical protein